MSYFVNHDKLEKMGLQVTIGNEFFFADQE